MNRVLLIEDDTDMCRLIESFLDSDTYHIRTAGTHEGAKALINNEESIDVVLMDFWLGSKNAIPLIDLLREKHPHVPIILISGGDGNVSLETTKAFGEISGATHFLQKPFRKKELIEALRTAI